ncbi:conserved hypothetical protein [Perkinsus marinus ATCC 50983]|uniref:EF-hand domain-containing protein n=1 Tax=Perkinsus marinus (strain ATCC 50983 / TXsc) TaxID=423536 RepID=C5L455_PERM5|nr:conserved hypothetical protein [Perkinsus marinus ATCC 50983]EER08488.1 conserved hypothetical protein [Perkinsus marinus ATCC 50983]|eukprot:XP_002776672.1 conserved hypothetical protein [Perkinsus marinus ATCC 50983]
MRFDIGIIILLFIATLTVAYTRDHHIIDDDFVIEDPYADLEELDGTATGGMNPREPEQLEEEFRRFDTNNDGGIDPQEVRAIYKGYMDQADLFKFYSEADKNEDGLIDMNEYKRMLE